MAQCGYRRRKAILSTTRHIHVNPSRSRLPFAAAHAFRFWLSLTTAMVMGGWVVVLRKRHAHTNTAQDPQSPQAYGIGALL